MPRYSDNVLGYSKYCSFTLETIASLELESSEALKDAILENWLVNVQGGPGKFIEDDIMQEHFNEVLDESRDHADADWDGNLMRNIVSRNVHHFLRIKKEWGAGLGLSDKSGTHSEPHTKPEVTKLLKTYKDTELHRFRPGRQYDSADVDDYSQRYNKLAAGGLQKWIYNTTRGCGLMEGLERDMAKEKEPVDDESDGDDEDNEDIEFTPGTSYMLDGILVIETADDFGANAAVNGAHDGEDKAMDVKCVEEDTFDEPELEYNDEI